MTMKNRKGFALMAAIWLCVAIAAVALQFSLEARERRLLGINTSERGKGRAAAMGALNATQAALDASLRQVVQSGGGNSGVRNSDPWLDVDSLFSGVILIDSIQVTVSAKDLGTQLNINNMNENQLRTFFSFALKDFSVADNLAQAILDFRDADSIARPNGAERDRYIEEGRLALPTNQPFREVGDMLDVMGMTPEIYAEVAPYLTTRGTGRINVNSADTVVLRSVPGMTDQVLAQIMAQRSRGRRIQNILQILPGGAAGRGRGNPPTAQQGQLAGSLIVDVTEIQLTLTAYVGPQQLPVRLNAIVTRGAPLANTASQVTWKQW